MEAHRPFSDPRSVTMAGLTLLAIGAASFASGLSRELSLPRPVAGATVIVMPPSEAPPPTIIPGLARLEPVAAPPARSKVAPKRPTPAAELAAMPAPQASPPAPAATPPTPMAPLAPPAMDAAQVADDAAATGPSELPPPEPTAPPQLEEPVAPPAP